MISAFADFQLPQGYFSGLLFLSLLASTTYILLWLNKPQSTLRSVAKVAPIIVLLFVALIAPLPVTIIAALGACAVGDWFLSLEGEGNFQLGLGAFLAGHLFYIAHFAPRVEPSTIASQDGLLLALILVALVAMVLLRLWPHLKELKIPVTVYAVVIAVMAYTARLALPGFAVIAGVALFLLSDILLAQDKFTPLTNTLTRRAMPYLVMAFYYLGQILIVFGLLTRTG